MQVQVHKKMEPINPPELKVKTLKFPGSYCHAEIIYKDKSADLVESVIINILLPEENIPINELKEKAIQKAKGLLKTIIQA